MKKWGSTPSQISAKDAMKAQMDALLGRDRNLSSAERARRQPHFSDGEHNKYYLAGLCPYELFSNTKDDLGPVPVTKGSVCDPKVKAEYDAISDEEQRKYGYEYDLFVFLGRIITDLDRKIARGIKRIDEEDREGLQELEKLMSLLTTDDRRRLEEITVKLAQLVDDAEKLAHEGDVGGALALLTQVDQLKLERHSLHSKLPKAVEDMSVKKLIICEVSGNFLSSTDSAERLRNHFEGKRYVGWKKVRDKYEELRAKNLRPGIPGWNPKKAADEAERQKKRKQEGGSATRDAKPSSSRPGDSDRDGGRDRDRGRGRDRDAGRDRDRDRDRRGRDRSRDRDRDRGRSRRRSRSRSRDRHRSRRR